jgi:Flp pilus assembly protein TadG
MNSPVAPRREAIRNKKERGVLLIWGTISMLLIIPMIGLAIDVGFLYSIKSKLQSAVDGAALASARALSIGSTLSSQETSATANANTWFNSNFPTGYFGTYNTTLGTPSYNSANQVMSISLTAQTTVDSFFMKWLAFGATTISATGTASRRTVVAMLVLDRSGSMCTGGTQPCTKAQTTLPCYDMIQAAKLFTGQFQEGTDYIGLVSFSDNVMVQSAPVTTFQSVLGYSNASGSSTGALDAIGCYGGTSTAEAMSIGYQLLHQTNLAGALNVLMLETDGLPNTLTMNFWDSTNSVAGLLSTSSCTDNETTGKTMAQGGFKSLAQVPPWTSGLNMTSTANGFLSSNSYYSNIPSGMIGSVSSGDPGDSPEGFWATLNYFTTSTGTTSKPFNAYTYSASSNGSPNYNCNSDGDVTTLSDIGWWPSTDVFGNSLNPSAYSYQTVTTDSKGHLTQTNSNPTNWQNYHNGVLNATDNAAYNARINSTIPATVFAIGLGGNSVNGPPDPVLLQRMANDPNGDQFNTTGPDAGGAYYLPCAQETGCATWSSQPQGTFIYAPSTTYLAEAFLRISSQVLRLSK